MLQPEKDNLLDQIYEAAFEPATWSVVFERIVNKMDGNSVWLSELDAYSGRGGTEDDHNARVDPAWLGRYAEYYGAINPLQMTDDPRRYLRDWRPVVLTDEDWMAKDDLIRTEFYNDFCKPQNVHSIMWIRMAISGSTIATLNITRSESMDRFTAADFKFAREYQPHLIRAFKLGKKIGASRRQARETEALLDFSAHGLFLLDGNGVLRHANRAAEKSLGEGGALALRGGKLCAAQPAASRTLDKLIATAASVDPALRTGGSMALSAQGRTKPFFVIVAPVGGEQFISLREGLSVCVCVTDLEAEVRLPEGALRDVLGLTRAESRLAQALFAGANLQEAANRFDVSLNTVRVQLASVFDKTQTNRQSELVALLSRLAQQQR